MYKALFNIFFANIDPEVAHKIGFRAIRAIDYVPVLSTALSDYCRADQGAEVKALGLSFPNAVGLAAGFDKNSVGVRGLSRLGYGAIEIGTVTAHAQPGNPKPRLFRIKQDKALANRMGFNNNGARAVSFAVRRERRKLRSIPESRRPVIGINIGKTKVVEGYEAIIADYVRSATELAPLADYLVINVSSPNTPGLRDLQTVESLRPLVTAVRETAAAVVESPRSTLGHVPLLVKIAPDLADADVLAIADLALELGIDGIIATNTTISRAGLHADPAAIEALGAGGISGEPLAARSMEVLRLLKSRVGDRVVLVSAGGITTPADARARIGAGATLIQGYSAFIYEGPFWARHIVRALRRQ